MDAQPTKQFGRYEVIAELGRGAMGVVYKARDPQIDRLVAVKTVRLLGQEPEQEEEFRQRFAVEAQAAGRLQHPGIVAVFDVGEEGDNRDPFIILEYVAGESLSRLLSKDRKLALPQALQLAEEIADALDYAHTQGVVHRDIKPANILLTEDGHAKITDFGIAKLNLAHFTLPGRVLGTPAYMAPEQLAGEGVDGRSDLFSLGVILYTMLTGHPPFHGDSATTVCFKVVNREPVPASTFNLELPRALDPVISKAMSKQPSSRYQTGAEFAYDIRHLRLQYTASTTGSLVPRMSTTSGVRTSRILPSLDSGAAKKDWRQGLSRIFRNTSTRDLLLGAGVVLLMLMVLLPARHVLSPQPSPAISTAAHNDVTPEALAKIMDAEDSADKSVDSGSAAQTTTTRNSSHRSGSTHRPLSEPASRMVVRPVIAQGADPLVPVKAVKSTTVVIPSSNVEVLVQHQFKQATLTIWVDDKQVVSRQLHGGMQRHMVVFNGIHGADSETVKVPAGTHTLRLRAVSSDFTVDLSKTITAEFVGGADRTLQVTFERHNTDMHLTWE